jgi:hypothetical protein
MYSRLKNGVLWVALISFFAAAPAMSEGYSLYLDLTGMTPHIGQDLYYRAIDLDNDVLVGSGVIALDDADTLFAVADGGIIVDDGDYRVDFYADFNGNGVYDAPSSDHAWREEIMGTVGDDTISFAHNTNFTDIAWSDEMEPNDVKVDAGEIELDEEYTGYIGTTNDRDRWILDTPTAAGTLSVTLTVPTESGLRLYLAVKDSSDSSYLGNGTMSADGLTLNVILDDGHPGQYIVKVRYGESEVGYSATIPYTISTEYSYAPRSLYVDFNGPDEYIGQLWKARLVNQDTGDELDRNWTILEPLSVRLARGATSANDIYYEWNNVLDVGGIYDLEFYIDTDMSGDYSGFPADSSWSVSIEVNEATDIEMTVDLADLAGEDIEWDDEFTWVYGGELDEDAVWASEGSPFYLADTVFIANDVTLEVGAGVDVMAYVYHSAIVVEGELVVSGTEADPVNFSTYHDDDKWSYPDPDEEMRDKVTKIGNGYPESWGGIDFLSANPSSIEWTRVAGGWGHLGGGIYVDDTELSLMHVLLEYNSADSAGALAADNNASITGNDVFMRWNNASTSAAGALGIRNSIVELDNAVVMSNESDGDAGGIGVDAGELVLNNARIAYNYASSRGGGIGAENESIIVINDSRIHNNYAEGDAGAIGAIDSVVIELNNVQIRNNEASNTGGGINISGSELVFNGGALAQNRGYLGTGLSLFESTAELRRVVVTSTESCCAPPEYLAGIALIESELRLVQSTVTQNVVGITVMDEYSKLDVNSSIIQGNPATGILTMSDGPMKPAPGGDGEGGSGEITVRYSNVQELLPPYEIGESEGDGYSEEDYYDAIYAFVSGPTPQSFGVWPGPGNIDLDPLFMDPEGVEPDFHLHFMSPAVNTGDPELPSDPDGTQADMGAHPLHINQTGLSARDVPEDQGGSVLLTWWASQFDMNVNDLTHYSVWRASPAGMMDDAGPPMKLGRIAETVVAWEWLTDLPAHRLGAYAYTASTNSDSTGEGPADHWFMVSAHTANPNVFHDSAPIMGRSVDNLAPSAPSRLAHVAGKLVWNSSPESDVNYYSIYRSRSIHSTAFGNEPYMTTIDTSITAEFPYRYGVAAVDFGGNESDFSVMAIVTNISAAAIPTRTSLLGNAPNPFNPETVINYQIHETANISISVVNINGQRVRTLVSGDAYVGRHSVIWDGKDDAGRKVASGLYLYQLTTSTGTRDVHRMMLVK